MSFGEPERLVIALYVRDAAGLTSQTDPVLPPLTPEVPAEAAVSARADHAAASEQWAAWWDELLALAGDIDRVRLPEPRPQLPELDARPAVQTVARALFRPATEFAQARKREVARFLTGPDGQARSEMALIREVTHRRRWRRVTPFDLRITELPVATKQGWHLSVDHVLVSRALRHDEQAYREWLRPIVDKLAWQ